MFKKIVTLKSVTFKLNKYFKFFYTVLNITGAQHICSH